MAKTDLLALSLEDLSNVSVSTASKFEQNIEDAPAVMSVITAEDIRSYGATNLLDILQHFPGFVPVADVTYGQRGSAIRGDSNVSAERVLILVDGRPYRSLASSATTSRMLYENFPLAAIAKLEFIRGPGSAIYGTNAVDGVLNIITRKNEDRTAEAVLNAGTQDSNGQSLFLADKGRDWNASLAAQVFRTDGFSVGDDFITNPPVQPAQPFPYDKPHRRQSLKLDAEYFGLSVNALLMDMKSNYVDPLQLIASDPIKAKDRYYNIGYDVNINDDWRLQTHLSNLVIQDTQFDVTDENWLFELDSIASLSEQAKLVSGINASRQTANTPSGQITRFKENRHSLFAQLQYQFNTVWSGHLGAQWNKVESKDSSLSPRLGLIWKASEQAGIKLLYDEAFRSPTASETDFEVPPFFFGNQDLKPETVQTLNLQWFDYRKAGHYSVTVFHSDYRDRIALQNISFIPVFVPGQFVQASDLTTYGAEFESQWKLGAALTLDAALTVQHNEDDAGNKDVTLAPRWTGNLGVRYRFANQLEASLFNQHVSAFFDNPNNVGARSPKPESYNLLSAQLRLPVSQWVPGMKPERIALSVYASNLLDEEIWQPELIGNAFNSIQATPGRGAWLNLEVKL